MTDLPASPKPRSPLHALALMLVQVRWRLILRNLWTNWTRTLLVVLSIAVGVFAIGIVAHMYILISDDLNRTYASINPSNANLYTTGFFDEETVEAIRRMPEVLAVEGRRVESARFRLVDGETWYPVEFLVSDDFTTLQIDKIEQELKFEPDPLRWPQGVWPPDKNQIVVERSSLLLSQLGLTRSRLGDNVVVESVSERQITMPIVGLAYDFSQTPAPFAGRASAFISFDTLERMGRPLGYNVLRVRVVGENPDLATIRTVAEEVRLKLEKGGVLVDRVEVKTPNKLPLDYMFRALVLILATLGFLALFLSGFLVTNTVSSVLQQQTRQIGVMKTIGAQQHQLLQLYIGMVLIFGSLSLLVAVPLAALGTREFISFLSYFLNFKASGSGVPPQVVLFEVLMGLLVPIIAAFPPILNGIRVTVREAITSTGLGSAHLGTGLIDRLLLRVRGLPRPIQLSLRNTFRRRGRLVLTVTTLMLAGTAFMVIMSARLSMTETLTNFFKYRQYDVEANFRRPYRARQVEAIALAIPGVTHAESWVQTGTYRLRPDETASEQFLIIAPPADTQMLRPTLTAGRWLLPNDRNAVVVNNRFLLNEPDVAVGSEIVLVVRGKERLWQVVGVVQTVDPIPVAYTPYPHLSQELGQPQRASSVQLVTEPRDAATQSRVVQELERRLREENIEVTSVQSIAQLRAQSEVLFTIITTLLLVMAGLLALVGGLGLSGTMSLNVLERTREIGVMRAIGASDDAVQQIVIVEGIVISLLSWALSLLCALLLGKPFSDALGLRLLATPLSYTFSWQGVLLWLGLVVVVATVASLLPAQSALRINVRSVLNYE